MFLVSKAAAFNVMLIITLKVSKYIPRKHSRTENRVDSQSILASKMRHWSWLWALFSCCNTGYWEIAMLWKYRSWQSNLGLFLLPPPVNLPEEVWIGLFFHFWVSKHRKQLASACGGSGRLYQQCHKNCKCKSILTDTSNVVPLLQGPGRGPGSDPRWDVWESSPM